MRRLGLGEERRRLGEFFEILHHHGTHPIEHGAVRGGRTGQRAGVRSGQVLPDFRAPELVDDHRLARRERAARRARQMIGVAQGFEEQQNRAGVRVVDQAVGDFAGAEIALIAH